ncbi:MAG: M56 family metallopeptidase, partial [Polyangiaceae bacterium]
ARVISIPSLVSPPRTPARPAASPPAAPAANPDAAPGAGVIAACALGASALGLLRFALALALLLRRLRGRYRVQDARLLLRLERIRARSRLGRLVLSQSNAVCSPLVIGLGEICVPVAILESLSDSEIDGVFAHELAHLERRDGIWFPLVSLVQSVLWLQPLNHWASSRFRDSAELACDDRAVELTGDPLGLARALVQVAAKSLFAPRFAEAPMMARSASALLPRVRRLTEAAGSGGTRSKRTSRLTEYAIVFALGIALPLLSVRVVRGKPAPLPVRELVAASSAAAASPPEVGAPDAAQQQQLVASLAAQQEAIEREIAELASRSGGHPDAAVAIRLDGLRAELARVRTNEMLMEEHFLDQWEAFRNGRTQPAASTR